MNFQWFYELSVNICGPSILVVSLSAGASNASGAVSRHALALSTLCDYESLIRRR
jgi:hypothetical protein